jgi:multidrug efflux pump subunit AcrA (membrane-fusion protein)
LQDELVHAAQQELHEQRRLRKQQHKLCKANKQEAVQAAQQLTEAPAAFAQFSACLLRFYRIYGIEWPTVTVAYRDLNVNTKVCTSTLPVGF